MDIERGMNAFVSICWSQIFSDSRFPNFKFLGNLIELRIDLTIEVEVLEMIKSNPLIERSRAPEGIWSFQYRKKFIIRYAIGYTMCIYAFSCFFMLSSSTEINMS